MPAKLGLLDSIMNYREVWAQLPDSVGRRLKLQLLADPYFIACTAVFTTNAGHEYTTKLLPNEHRKAIKIPDEFIAYLCLVVT